MRSCGVKLGIVKFDGIFVLCNVSRVNIMRLVGSLAIDRCSLAAASLAKKARATNFNVQLVNARIFHCSFIT